MTLTFLGTRGNIEVRTRRHHMHTATLLSYRGAAVMIDCGADWLRVHKRLDPDAIVLTHAHSDHVDGLKNGAPCAVYASPDVWRRIGRWPIEDVRQLGHRSRTAIRGIMFEAFPVEHSINVPAVGYRITAGRTTIFYVPDVLGIPDRSEALSGIAAYIGDGATISRPIVRRVGKVPVGHATISTQLDWCAEAGVPRAIFTHCGTRIVEGGVDTEALIPQLGRSKRVETRVAYDGLRIRIR